MQIKLDGDIVSVDKLFPNTWNPNKQNDFIFEKEKESIRKFGFVTPVIVRQIKEGYEIIDGEHRLKAAKELGLNEISINNLGEVSDSVAKQLTIVLNETKGEPDPIELSKLINDLSKDVSVEDLLATLPFQKEELEGMMDLLDFDWDQYDIEEPTLKEEAPKMLTCPHCGEQFEE